MEDDPERRSAHRVLYEAIRRLPGQAWFQESKAKATYLQLQCNSTVQAVPNNAVPNNAVHDPIRLGQQPAPLCVTA